MKIIPDFLRLNAGENLSRRLFLDVTDFSDGFAYKLSFITPMGKIYLTEELVCPDGKGEYKLPSVLLDGKGVLYCQLYISGENGFVIKSEIYEFPVYSSCDTGSFSDADENEIKSFFDLFSLIDEKSEKEHNHDGLYYLKRETERLLSAKSDISHTHGEYARKEDVPVLPENVSEFNNDAGYVTEPEMNSALSEKSDASHTHPHNHDERYYTKDNIDSMMEGSALSGHNHDSRYYTEEETDSLLSGKSDTSHTHPHNHDDLYSKKTDFSGLQKDVAANSSSIADIRNECDSLEEQLGSVEQKQNTQALSLQLISKSVEKIMDCVVEEGVSGIWTYRKWYSGIAECWGVFNTTYSTTFVDGGNYALIPEFINVSLPENFFSQGPVTELTPVGGGYPAVVIGNIYKTNFTFSIRTEWAVNNLPIWLQVRCIGRWK